MCDRRCILKHEGSRVCSVCLLHTIYAEKRYLCLQRKERTFLSGFMHKTCFTPAWGFLEKSLQELVFNFVYFLNVIIGSEIACEGPGSSDALSVAAFQSLSGVL